MAAEETLTEEQIAALDAEGKAGDDSEAAIGVNGDGGGVGDPSPAPPPSPEEIERKLAKIDAAFEKYRAAVERIMGDDFSQLIVSPFDWRPGFIFDPAIAPPEPAAIAMMQSFLGTVDGRDLREATDAVACPSCNAWGEVVTGSKVEGQRTKPCQDCSGTGWRSNIQAPTPITAYQPSQGVTTGALPPNTPIQVADQWGRPAGHPHYGITPAQVGA